MSPTAVLREPLLLLPRQTWIGPFRGVGGNLALPSVVPTGLRELGADEELLAAPGKGGEEPESRLLVASLFAPPCDTPAAGVTSQCPLSAQPHQQADPGLTRRLIRLRGTVRGDRWSLRNEDLNIFSWASLKMNRLGKRNSLAMRTSPVCHRRMLLWGRGDPASKQQKYKIPSLSIL